MEVNAILAYWMDAPLAIALLMATGVHLLIYLIGGAVGFLLTERLWPRWGIGQPIDAHQPRPGQIRDEFRNGIAACLIFGVITLSYRFLCRGLWPSGFWTGVLQISAFFAFNNVYSYVTHRILHLRPLLRFHRVHHRSVRVTPWSGYSVHAFEAVVIGLTLPLFMLIMPLGVGTAFVLHALGMLFTTCIHCNYDLLPTYPTRHWLKRLTDDPAYHHLHHVRAGVTYGFTSRWMDRWFHTEA